MAGQAVPLGATTEKAGFRGLLLGSCLGLAGVVIIEGLFTAGLRPLTPMAWPGVGALAGAALGGAAGFAGGSLVLGVYYLVNLLQPHRFPEFYGHPYSTISWLVGLAVMGALILALRPRLMRAGAAEAEARALRAQAALRESEARLRTEVAQLAAARAELIAEHARLEAALEGSNLALWDTDLRTGRVYLSEVWAQIAGEPRGARVSSVEELLALLHPDDVEPLRRVSLEVMKGTRASYALEHRVRTAGGEWRWILSRGRVTERDPASGRAVRMIGTNLDITDRRRLEEALQSVAQSDALTGLANRLLFQDRLRQALARARRAGSRIALLYLDLDRFKEVNDSLGHAGGDLLLKDFAARLRAGVRATDTVARFGGDEFVILLEDVKEPEHALRVAEKIVLESRQPLIVEGREVLATASVGVAFGDGDSASEDLLRRADAALYEAKGAGRNGYRVAALP